jgi:periplasmic protein TonB
MKTLFLFLLLANCAPLWSQEPAIPEKETIVAVPDEPAQFPGDNEALRKFLADSIHYPAKCTDGACDVKIFVRFVVTSKGTIVAPEIMRGAADCPECDKEVLRIVRIMPDWIPGKVNGVPVHSYFNLPIQIHSH